MPPVLHVLIVIFATSMASVTLYWLMRKYNPTLAKGSAVIIAIFGGALISVAAIKTNSPPARAIHNVITALCTNIFNAAERQTGYAMSQARTNEIHDLTMPEGARIAESIARRGAHDDGFYLFDAFTNRLAREGLDLEHPVWVQTDGTVTIRSPAPGIPIAELSQTTVYSNITVYAPLQGSYGFLPAGNGQTSSLRSFGRPSRTGGRASSHGRGRSATATPPSPSPSRPSSTRTATSPTATAPPPQTSQVSDFIAAEPH